MDATDFAVALKYLDSYDAMYWEHRMSTWLGPTMNERDFYTESFVPFNTRKVYETLLGAPKRQRLNDENILRMIELADPKLLDWPINPETWPEKVKD